MEAILRRLQEIQVTDDWHSIVIERSCRNQSYSLECTVFSLGLVGKYANRKCQEPNVTFFYEYESDERHEEKIAEIEKFIKSGV